MPDPALRKFMRLADVRDATGLPTSTIYDMMARGTFPANFRLSAKSVAWDAEAIAKWQSDRLAAASLATAA